MTLKSGTFVVQYLNSSHRYGVIYKTNRVDTLGWSYFDVTWASGDRSTERADRLKVCKDIDKTIEELVGLRKYCK